MCVRGTRELLLESVFNVNICYLMKLKLASGNAYNCNDRSGINLKEKMYFFIFILC